jgi:hypothetical protein
MSPFVHDFNDNSPSKNQPKGIQAQPITKEKIKSFVFKNYKIDYTIKEYSSLG